MPELHSLGWLKSKREAIINGDNDFQNALDDALNSQNTEKDPQRISKLKPYINKYNWERIDFPAGPKNWKKFEWNNKAIALNILFIPHNTETIRVAYRSEHNKRKKQVILLMITDGKKQHYLPVTNLSALLQGKSSNHREGFYCLNCCNSYTTKNKHEEHEEICINHDSCHVEMPKWVEKRLKYNPGEKRRIRKKEQSWKNNPKKPYTEKKAKHKPSVWAMFTKCSFDGKENRLDYSRRKDWKIM